MDLTTRTGLRDARASPGCAFVRPGRAHTISTSECPVRLKAYEDSSRQSTFHRGGIDDELRTFQLAAGITTVALATLALLSHAYADSEEPEPVKAGQLFNGDKIRSTYEAMRVVERGRRLLNAMPPEDVRSRLPTLVTKLAEDLNAEGYDHTSISPLPGFRAEGARTGVPTGKRPLQIAFYDRLDATRLGSQKAYIMEELLPATGVILARSMRLRTPSGPLLLAGIPDEEGQAIPVPSQGTLLHLALTDAIALRFVLWLARGAIASAGHACAAASSCHCRLTPHVFTLIHVSFSYLKKTGCYGAGAVSALRARG